MINRSVSFVLSTGRTGTVTLTRMINAAGEGVRALHEPSPSRRFHILGKFYLEGKLHGRLLSRYYFHTRKKVWGWVKLPHVVEVNPNLWAWGPILCQEMDNPRILHVVRDFPSYVPSRLNYKARGWRRYVVDFVPFWKSRYNKILRLEQWASMPLLVKAAWHWMLLNKAVEISERYTERYMRVRFEDIFTNDRSLQAQTLAGISLFLDVDLDGEKACRILEQRSNVSVPRRFASFSSFPEEIRRQALETAAPLRKRYGYLGAPPSETPT